jgi:hypothetical protein
LGRPSTGVGGDWTLDVSRRRRGRRRRLPAGAERRREKRGEKDDARRFIQGNWATSRATTGGVTKAYVVPHQRLGMRQPDESRQCTWHDSFISRINQTGTIEKSQIKKSFDQIHFSNFN